MTRNLVTLSPEASVAEALTLCRERRIRHIPIVEEGRLVGIVSDRDLRDASPAQVMQIEQAPCRRNGWGM
jgi:acetoin utilization protein AcuB